MVIMQCKRSCFGVFFLKLFHISLCQNTFIKTNPNYCGLSYLYNLWLKFMKIATEYNGGTTVCRNKFILLKGTVLLLLLLNSWAFKC